MPISLNTRNSLVMYRALPGNCNDIRTHTKTEFSPRADMNLNDDSDLVDNQVLTSASVCSKLALNGLHMTSWPCCKQNVLSNVLPAGDNFVID